MTIRTDGPRTRITTEPMAGRATPAPVDRAFRSTLRDGAGVLLGGVEAAARSLPGGEIVAAAIDGAGRAGSPSAPATAFGTDAGSPLDGAHTLLGSGNESMELIALQQEIQEENRRYSTLSNVLKARHETAKNAIGNIR